MKHAKQKRTLSEAAAYEDGAWHAFDKVIDYLNTLESKSVEKKQIYSAIMDMRPWHLDGWEK